MLKLLLIICVVHALLACPSPSTARSSSDSSFYKQKALIDRFSDKMLKRMQSRYSKLESKLSRYNTRSLTSMQKQDQSLQRQVSIKDSSAGNTVWGSIDQQYSSLLQQVNNPTHQNASLSSYLPHLDSMETSLRFIDQLSGKLPGVPADKIKQLQALSSQLKSVQAQIQTASGIREFIQTRKALLKQQLDKLGMGEKLKTVNKQVYYYQQQISEYKSIINDPGKLEKRALTLLVDVPAFKAFMSKNSLLAQLFPQPAGYGTAVALQGLQSRSVIQQQLTQQLGSGASAQQYVQSQVSQAQAQMDQLKDKINKLGGGSSDLAIPEFKPNGQKTKSFWKRVEYGINIQSQKTNALLPTTSDIALTMGYKLNDKMVVGIGAGYKLGWGKNISNIHITNQGVSIRSYADIKLKGSLWITGGYEENYQHEFTRIDQLKDVSAWQRSGLAGVTKKYSIGKKKGNMQLLWDFLSYSQLPKTTALKFRVGYTL